MDAVIVGCDRVAANGDVANKVGTYGLALAAQAADIPFVVAGPTSTVDLATPTGREITIEERDADEVRAAAGQRVTLPETPCRNPAFDVTPAELITALVTERGVDPLPRRGVARVPMRVARSFAPGDVRIEEAPEPEPGPGEVVCDVVACGVCGSDVTDWYIASRLPAVLGHEVVGIVRAVGPGVTAPSPGTRVAIHHHTPCGECRRCRRGHETLCERFRATRLDPGGFAERVRVSQDLVEELLELPDGLDPVTATFIEPLACVLRAQDRAGLRAGDSLLVVGAGINGVLQIAAAHARGVEVVWVREPRPERLELAEAWGAEHHGNELVDVAIACTPEARGDRGGRRGGGAGRHAVLLRAARPRRATPAGRHRAVPARDNRDRQLLGRTRRHAGGARADRKRAHRSPESRLAPAAAGGDRPRARSAAARARAQGRGGAVKAALLFGNEYLRVEEVPEPEGEVIVEVHAATTCGTDVKMWRHGHRVLPRYPCAFGHETAGVRIDTGERVLVSDSVACGTCDPCRADRVADLPRADLGARRLRRADRCAGSGAPPHPRGPARRRRRRWPSHSRPRVHAIDRGSDATDVGVLGGGPMGLMLTSLLVAQGRSVTVADPHPERRAQAAELGATPADELRQHDLVFEAVGRPDAWRAAAAAAAPGGVVVLVGGCPGGTDITLPTGPLHYEELELRGSFHHSPGDVDRALAVLAADEALWRTLLGPTIPLEQLPAALASPNGGPAQKWVVDRSETRARLNSRCSTIRRESQIASPSITSTGTLPLTGERHHLGAP